MILSAVSTDNSGQIAFRHFTPRGHHGDHGCENLTYGRSIRAFASITLTAALSFADVQLVERSAGYFVRMRTVKGLDGKVSDIAYVLNAKTRKMIEDKVISEYQKVTAAKPPAGKSNQTK